MYTKPNKCNRKMKIYLVGSGWSDDGGAAPIGIFDSKEQAMQFIESRLKNSWDRSVKDGSYYLPCSRQYESRLGYEPSYDKWYSENKTSYGIIEAEMNGEITEDWQSL